MLHSHTNSHSGMPVPLDERRNVRPGFDLTAHLNRETRAFNESLRQAGLRPGMPQPSAGSSPLLTYGKEVSIENTAIRRGVVHRGLEASLAANAALTEACTSAEHAMGALQGEVAELIAGVEGQLKQTLQQFEVTWEQQENDIAGMQTFT